MRKPAIVEDNTPSGKELRFDFGKTNYWLPFLVEFLIYLTTFFSLRETLHFLYADDDLITSLLKGASFLDGVTVNNFFQFTLHLLDLQIRSGRILIGDIIMYLPPLFLNIYQYRLYVLILICINVWLFGKCIYQWTNSYKIKWFSMLLAPLFFQIHYNFHHPILSYWGLMQLLFILLFSSMYFFWKYCTEHKKRWLVISGLLYLWGLILYEVAYVFILVFILLAYFATKDIKKSVLRSIPHISILSVLIIATLISKTGLPQGYTGDATANINILKIISTTIKQTEATFPLTNFMANNWVQYRTWVPKLFLVSSIKLDDILTVILFLIALYLIYRTTETNFKINKKNTLLIGLLGFMMVLLPSGLMGLSARYQNEIRWGAGHIPVYIQYFGLIILLVAVYIFVREILRKFDTKKIVIRSINSVMVVLSVFILLTNQQYGRAQIKIVNSFFYDNMLALQYSLEDGIIGDISDDALIINSQVVPTYLPNSFYSSEFFVNYSQKRLENVVYVDDLLDKLISDYKAQGKLSGTIDYPTTKPTYIVRTNRDPINGVIYIGRVKNLTIDLDNKKITRCEIDELRIYAMDAVTSKYISVYEKNNGEPYLQTYYQLEPNLLNTGTRGRIYKFVFDPSVVDFYNAYLVYDIDNIDPGFYNVGNLSRRIDLAKPAAGNNQNINGIFVSGWSGIEAWGRWSDGKQAVMDMKVREIPGSDLQVTFQTNIFAPGGKLNFSVLVNGASVGDFSLPPEYAEGQTFSVIVPKDNVIGSKGELKIVFDIQNPESPAQAGLSTDPRQLGIGIVSFVIKTVTN